MTINELKETLTSNGVDLSLERVGGLLQTTVMAVCCFLNVMKTLATVVLVRIGHHVEDRFVLAMHVPTRLVEDVAE